MRSFAAVLAGVFLALAGPAAAATFEEESAAVEAYLGDLRDWSAPFTALATDHMALVREVDAASVRVIEELQEDDSPPAWVGPSVASLRARHQAILTRARQMANLQPPGPPPLIAADPRAIATREGYRRIPAPFTQVILSGEGRLEQALALLEQAGEGDMDAAARLPVALMSLNVVQFEADVARLEAFKASFPIPDHPSLDHADAGIASDKAIVVLLSRYIEMLEGREPDPAAGEKVRAHAAQIDKAADLMAAHSRPLAQTLPGDTDFDRRIKSAMATFSESAVVYRQFADVLREAAVWPKDPVGRAMHMAKVLRQSNELKQSDLALQLKRQEMIAPR